MRSPERVLVTVIGPQDNVESRIMNHIAHALGEAKVSHDVFRTTKILDMRFCKQMAQCDILLLPSPLLLTFFYALMARYWYRKPIVGIAWDSYPVTLDGTRYNPSFRRQIFDWIENKVIKLCKQILVPSADFLEEHKFADACVVRLWHPVDKPLSHSKHEDKNLSGPLKVIFAGQINATRGLGAAVARLSKVTGGNFHLKVASNNPLPEDLIGNPKVEHIGYLDRAALHQVAAECDCGLVALAKNFDGPGLPSKTFEYLKMGLPCLYYGKRLQYYLNVLEQSGAGTDIGSHDLQNLDRGEILYLKQNIAVAAVKFSNAFELDPPALIAILAKMRA